MHSPVHCDMESTVTMLFCFFKKAPSGDRTHDRTLTKRMLCQLSYRGITKLFNCRIHAHQFARAALHRVLIYLRATAKGICIRQTVMQQLYQKATARGFEPLRAEPNGFRVHLLNRSDTLSVAGNLIIIIVSGVASRMKAGARIFR